jgi:CBS domain-containing protein
MNVLDAMTRDPKSCRPEDDVAFAAKVMWDHDCGCVPVVDGENRLVGIVTDRDVCMAALMSGRPLYEIRVTSVMARDVVACKPNDRLSDAQVLMRRSKIRRLPVTDRDGRLLGILSLHDIARVAEAARGLFPPVRLKEVARTFAEVTRSNESAAVPSVTADIPVPQYG